MHKRKAGIIHPKEAAALPREKTASTQNTAPTPPEEEALILSDLHIDAAAGEGDTRIAVLRCDGFVAAAAPGAAVESLV